MAKVVIFGGRGFIGSQLLDVMEDSVAPSIDIADVPGVRAVLDREKPSIVINAAGKTGKPNIDWCEDHRMETVRSNVTGPLILLDECMKRGIYFVHIGSGCIYDGPPPSPDGFSEDDQPNFMGSFYSLTKLTIDQLLRPFPVLQVRLRMPFSGTSNPRNLITKLRGYKKVLDVRNSITYIPDFIPALTTLISKKATGIFNIVNHGAISPYEIMVRYQKTVDPDHRFERLELGSLPSVVKAARSNCVLSAKKLESQGIKMLSVDEAIELALSGFRKS